MKIKKISIVFLVFLILGIGGYQYVFKSHRDISKESAAVTLVASDFYTLVTKEANRQEYLDKTVQLTGSVTEIDTDNFTLDHTIICYTDTLTIAKITLDQVLVIKGRSIGFDELLQMPKIDQTTLLETKKNEP